MAVKTPPQVKPAEEPPALHFRVSTGLKSIIGRDLIVSDFVALFELVKNSFDARAKHVRIIFDNSAIWVVDDGKGMTYEDLVSKWLFVAYSAKRDGTEDTGGKGPAAQYAGNKGVGRFSCDRLGEALTLQTKSSTQKAAAVHRLDLSWERFDRDQTEEFVDIPVDHSEVAAFEMPKGVKAPAHGTVLRIGRLRDDWDRDRLLRLRAHLEKLINPFESNDDTFVAELFVPAEDARDADVKARIAGSPEDEIPALERQIVNGPIKNFVFAELADKTTRIEVAYNKGTDLLETSLIDRGKVIYRIQEESPYQYLGAADFRCRLFFLNQAAKTTFTRRTGVPAVQFGSVFLFRNGFRVFPIGEEGDDAFEIDRRKQQGYARFLGTRDIIGRIDVRGSEQVFKEATSRDQGLVRTPAYEELLDCFRERCLKRLESYVVGVTWQDKLDKLREDASGLASAPARARVIEVISALTRGSNITVLDYATDLVDVLSERVQEFESSLQDLKQIARNLKDGALEKRIAGAERRYRELKEAEARARDAAEKEIAARREAELRARAADELRVKAERDKDRATAAYEEEKKRNLLLAGVTSLDLETVTHLHHQITIYSANIHELVEMQIEALATGLPDKESLLTFLEQMRFQNQHVMAIARLATRANFRMQSDAIREDVASYIAQYVSNVTPLYQDRIRVEVQPPSKTFERVFKPIELSIIVDNFVVNARRANAKTLRVLFDFATKDVMRVAFVDDGKGLDPTISEPHRVFEKGFSTTDGSGLGLYHCRQIMESLGGTIELRPAPTGRGVALVLTFPSK